MQSLALFFYEGEDSSVDENVTPRSRVDSLEVKKKGLKKRWV